MVRFIIFLVFLVSAVVYAFRCGGAPEKRVALVLAGIQATDIAYHLAGGDSSYIRLDAFHAFNDAWALIALVAIALNADRFWTLWVAALQLIATFAHYARAIDLSVHQMAYAIMIRFPMWLEVAVLILGTWNFARQQKARAACTISPPFSRG
jgi:hypothetical protein